MTIITIEYTISSKNIKMKQLILILLIVLNALIANCQTPILKLPPDAIMGKPIVDFKDGTVYSYLMSKDGEVKNSRKQLGNRATLKVVGKDYHIKFLDINGKKCQMVIRFWKECNEECCGGLWNQYTIEGILYCAKFSPGNKKIIYYESSASMFGYSIENLEIGRDIY